LNTPLTLRVRSDDGTGGILYLRQVRVGPAADGAESERNAAGHGQQAATHRDRE